MHTPITTWIKILLGALCVGLAGMAFIYLVPSSSSSGGDGLGALVPLVLCAYVSAVALIGLIGLGIFLVLSMPLQIRIKKLVPLFVVLLLLSPLVLLFFVDQYLMWENDMQYNVPNEEDLQSVRVVVPG